MPEEQTDDLKAIEKKSAEGEVVEPKQEEVTPAPPPVPISPPTKKKRLSFLKSPKLRRAKTPQPETALKVKPLAEPLSAEELVNTLDQDLQILSESPQETLSKEMKAQIDEAKGDTVTLKITRGKLVMVTAAIILMVWLSIGLQHKDNLLFTLKQLSSVAKPETTQEASNSAETSTEASRSSQHVRISTNRPEHEDIILLAEQLKLVFTEVELVEEEVAETNVLISTQASNSAEFDRILSFVPNRDTATRSASVLSEDSDVNILIVYPVAD